MRALVIAIATAMLAACGPKTSGTETTDYRAFTEHYAFNITSVPSPPHAREKTVVRIRVRDKHSSQPHVQRRAGRGHDQRTARGRALHVHRGGHGSDGRESSRPQREALLRARASRGRPRASPRGLVLMATRAVSRGPSRPSDA